MRCLLWPSHSVRSSKLWLLYWLHIGRLTTIRVHVTRRLHWIAWHCGMLKCVCYRLKIVCIRVRRSHMWWQLALNLSLTLLTSMNEKKNLNISELFSLLCFLLSNKTYTYNITGDGINCGLPYGCIWPIEYNTFC